MFVFNLVIFLLFSIGFADAYYNVYAMEYASDSKGFVDATFSPSVCNVGKIVADSEIDGFEGYGLGFVNCTFETAAIYEQWEVVWPEHPVDRTGTHQRMQINMGPRARLALETIVQTLSRQHLRANGGVSDSIISKNQKERQKIKDRYQKIFDEQFETYKQKFHAEFSAYEKKIDTLSQIKIEDEPMTIQQSEDSLTDDLNSGFDISFDFGKELLSLSKYKKSV